MNKNYKNVLTIAGFDGGGGAGIQADLKTISALGCYGLSVLTALPVQNTKGVCSIYSFSDQCIKEQLQSIFEDYRVDAVKVGMLYQSDVVVNVHEVLQKYSDIPIVVDPVMRSTSGSALIEVCAVNDLVKRLFPCAMVVTPNLLEASEILQRKIFDKADVEEAAKEISQFGSRAVVIKGGHFDEDFCDDCLYSEGKIHWFSAPRVITQNTHGTGCTLASAIAVFIAKGYDIVQAVSRAKQYLFKAIEAGADYEIGHGHGPVHHFFSFW